MQTVHKEDATVRITSDKSVREGLRQKPNLCIDPLNSEQHPQGIINSVNGGTAPTSVNVDKAVEIVTREIEELKENCLKDSMISYQRKP